MPLISNQVIFLSVLSGVASAVIAPAIGCSGDWSYWFLLGSAACFYSFGYAELLDSFWSWWRTQPKFKGFRYWIKKTFKQKEEDL